MMNKKGQEMWVIVAVILALVLGGIFLYSIGNASSTGGSFFSNLFSPKSTVQAIVTGCNTACDTGNIAGYCDTQRLLKFDSAKEGPFGTLESGTSYTCNQIGSNLPGLEGCATITCPA